MQNSIVENPMTMKTFLIYGAGWIGMAAIGIFNGILREYSGL